MTSVLLMTAVCVVSWLAVAAVEPGIAAEVFFGMFGPLVAVCGTWILVARAARVNPAGLTSLMVAAFAVKMAFFALYVVAVIGALGLDLTSFALSFATYFVGLYATEALLLRRLFSSLT